MQNKESTIDNAFAALRACYEPSTNYSVANFCVKELFIGFGEVEDFCDIVANLLTFLTTNTYFSSLFGNDRLAIREYWQSLLLANICVEGENISNLELIAEDLFCYTEDPAFIDYLDTLVNYQGFHALTIHRLAHSLWQREDSRRDARLLQRLNVKLCAVDIHPGASFGRRIGWDHAVGSVIGEESRIGNDCWLLHNITLGGSGKKGERPRHPYVGNQTFIGAGAMIVGHTKIADNCAIGAGTLVLPHHLKQAQNDRFGQMLDSSTGLDNVEKNRWICVNPRSLVIV